VIVNKTVNPIVMYPALHQNLIKTPNQSTAATRRNAFTQYKPGQSNIRSTAEGVTVSLPQSAHTPYAIPWGTDQKPGWPCGRLY